MIFEKGDRVQIVSKIRKGERGIVSQIMDDHLKVDFDDDYWYYRFDEIFLIERKNKDKYVFRLGDKVKVSSFTGRETKSSVLSVGDFGVVTDTGRAVETNTQIVRLNRLTGGWVDIKDLELIRSYQFDIGDKVEIISSTGSRTDSSVFEVGYIGIISHTGSTEDGDQVVRLDNHKLGRVNVEDIRLARPYRPKFKRGDAVIILDVNLEDSFYTENMKDTVGETGFIMEVFENCVEVGLGDDIWHYRFEDVDTIRSD